MIFKELSGPRIRLINFSMDYVNDVHEYSVMPQFYEFLEYPPFTGIRETEQFLGKLMKRSNGDTGHYWFIYHLEAKKVIGTIGLIDIDRRKGSAELGYGLSPAYWGVGLFSEAIKLVIEWFFEEPRSHRLFIKTAAGNISSIKTATKMGFKREGLFRDFYLNDQKNERSDAVLLSMLKTDITG